MPTPRSHPKGTPARGAALLRLVLGALVELVFPTRCALCHELLGSSATGDEAALSICAGCLARVGASERSRCRRCDAQLGPGSPPRGGCDHCRALAPDTPRLVVVGPYEDGLGACVRDLKFHGRIGNARPLGALLARRLRARPGRYDCLVPVPTTRSRERARGFNQAAEISRAAGERLDLPVEDGALTRRRETPQLLRRSRSERRALLEDAFAADPGRVRGRRIILVDDVLTTGATLASCTRALRRAGARAVLGACVARRHMGGAYA